MEFCWHFLGWPQFQTMIQHTFVHSISWGYKTSLAINHDIWYKYANKCINETDDIFPQVLWYYSDVKMGAMASQITGVSMVCSTVYSGADQRKYQSSASLAFVREIHRWPVNSPHKGPVTRKISIWWRHHDIPWSHHLLMDAHYSTRE